jgi:predicted nucleic acid-binding protein
MAASVLADAGFLVALLSKRDSNHAWAVTQAQRHAPPWHTCEAVLSEAFYLLGERGRPALTALLRRGAAVSGFALAEDLERPL